MPVARLLASHTPAATGEGKTRGATLSGRYLALTAASRDRTQVLVDRGRGAGRHLVDLPR